MAARRTRIVGTAVETEGSNLRKSRSCKPYLVHSSVLRMWLVDDETLPAILPVYRRSASHTRLH